MDVSVDMGEHPEAQFDHLGQLSEQFVALGIEKPTYSYFDRQLLHGNGLELL